MAGTVPVQYTGAEPCSQPALGFVGEKAWQPGQTHDVDEAIAEILVRGEGSSFVRAQRPEPIAEEPAAQEPQESTQTEEPAAPAEDGHEEVTQ